MSSVLARGVALMLVLGVVVSGSGCLGLIPSRELLEGFRGEPTTELEEQKYQLNHTFDSLYDPTKIQYYDSIEPIPIDEEVTMLKLHLHVGMPFDNFEQFTEQGRYVKARLIDPSGGVWWNVTATNSSYPPVESRLPPYPHGNWKLEVEARGYGGSVGVTEFHDYFSVSVTVVEPVVHYHD